MKKKNSGKKLVVLLLALTLVFGCAVGGTLAWLIDTTDPVTNTFTAGNIDITLTEEGAVYNAQSFKMVPGTDIIKKPVVAVLSGSEACWLFIKVDAATGVVLTANETAATYITYDIDTDEWTALPGVDGVYYKQIDATTAAAGATYGILEGDKVSVPDTVTKAMMDAVDDGTAKPTLSFTAYAVQQHGHPTAADAWTTATTP